MKIDVYSDQYYYIMTILHYTTSKLLNMFLPFFCGRAYNVDGSLGLGRSGLFNIGSIGADLYRLSFSGSTGFTLNIGLLFNGGSESLVSLSDVLGRERPCGGRGSSVKSPVDNAAYLDFFTD